MQGKEQSIKTTEYWMAAIQSELGRQLKSYMDEKGLNPTQMAKELGVAKSYITQVLKGKFNYSLQKLVELSLALGVAPQIQFQSIGEYLLKEEKKGQKRVFNVRGSAFLAVKGGKDKVTLQHYENSIINAPEVYEACTITPTDIKIA